MAIVLGTNAGFVSISPTIDPTGTGFIGDAYIAAQKDTSPVTAVKVTEIGFWVNTQGNEGLNFEVGLYTDNGGGVNSVPVNLLAGADQVNVMPSGSNIWVRVSGLNITINGSTPYWIAIQIDNCVTNISLDYGGSSSRNVLKSGQTTLIDPWSGGTFYSSILAIYALWEAAIGEINNGIFFGAEF